MFYKLICSISIITHWHSASVILDSSLHAKNFPCDEIKIMNNPVINISMNIPQDMKKNCGKKSLEQKLKSRSVSSLERTRARNA